MSISAFFLLQSHSPLPNVHSIRCNNARRLTWALAAIIYND